MRDRTRNISGVATIAALTALASGAGAGTAVFCEQGKSVATDAMPMDFMGDRVIFGDDRFYVGARQNDANAANAGAAYAFDLATGAQVMRFDPDDPTANEAFGQSMAYDGGRLLVGSPLKSDPLTFSGAAYLFDASTGAQLAKLTPSDPSSQKEFAWSVGLSGSIAVIGARWDTSLGFRAGAAYVFTGMDAVPSQSMKLLAPDGASGDNFGDAVAIDGGLIAVASPFDDADGVIDRGAVYLFDAATGTFLSKVMAPDAGQDDRFGISIDLRGGTLLVGAVLQDDPADDGGAAYVFDVSNPGAPSLQSRLPIGGLADDDFFGTSVGLSDTGGVRRAVVGAVGDDARGSQSGAAYVYDLTDLGNPTLLGKLHGSDSDFESFVGTAVAVRGDLVLASATGDGEMGMFAGAVYRFDLSAGPGIFTCEGDATLDSAVDLADLNLVLSQFGQPAAPCTGTDLDGSGLVDLPDLNQVLANFGSSCG